VIVSLEPELLERLSRLDGASTAVSEELNADLAVAVRRAAIMRRLFYVAVLAVALYGTATGAISRFGLPWPVAVGGIFALELGGVVFLSNAEVRRRLGEHAALSRLLGAAVATAAATFNLLTHDSVLFGGFFALMSGLGFVAWWLDAENKRRDRLRAHGQLPATTPAYELVGHWLRHPLLTNRARGFAKAYPQLGLYGSLEAAVITVRREKRNAALAAVLRARIRAAVGKDLAAIAVLTFDMDEVAKRLRADADYDGLTALLGRELTAQRVMLSHDQPTPTATRAPLTAHRSGALTPPRPDRDHRPAQELDPDLPADDKVRALDAGSPALGGMLPPSPNGVRAASHPRARHATTTSVGQHEHAKQPAAPRERDGAASTDRAPRAADPVNVRVSGTPALLDANARPVRGLRTKSLELLVYLTMHPAGARHGDIVADIWPGVPAERAGQRLSTCLANLRSVIRHLHEAIGLRAEPIVNAAGTYHLDPATVSVDWWPTTASPAAMADDAAPWPDARNEAMDSLAENTDYPWIDVIRQRIDRDSSASGETGTIERRQASTQSGRTTSG
jgi:hypothetical protein